MPRKDDKKPDKPKKKPRGHRLDENGGEVVSVTVRVNNKLVFSRAAVITGNPNGPNRRYKTDDGDEIHHKRDDGYKEIAKKLLNK